MGVQGGGAVRVVTVFILGAFVLIGVVASASSAVVASSSSITGAVTDTNGTPIPDVGIDLFTTAADGTRGQYLRTTRTTADGTYTLEADQGCYTLTFIAPQSRTFASTQSRWLNAPTCITNNESNTINATLNSAQPSSGSITGTVTDTFGVPMPDVGVDLFTTAADGARGQYLRSTTTSADGTYTLEPEQGCYTLTFIAPQDRVFATTQSRWLNTATCITSDQPITINATLNVSGPLVGIVTDTNGLPVADIGIDLFTTAADGARGRYLRSTTTAADGTYAFQADLGCYTLTFIAPQNRTFASSQTRWLNIRPCITNNQPTTINATLNASGSPDRWAVNFGGQGSGQATDVALDRGGNTVVSGMFSGRTDFDPGVGEFVLATQQSSQDAFVTKLGPSGELLWVLSFGSPNLDGAYGITVDDEDDIYVTGVFSGSVDFDPGPGVAMLQSTGSIDAFVIKLDPDGELIWATGFGSTGGDNSFDVVVDRSGKIAVVGKINGPADIELGSGETALGVQGLFAAELNQSGQVVWATGLGGGPLDAASGIAFSPTGEVVITGFSETPLDLDPGPDVAELPLFGDLDVVVVKFDELGIPLWGTSIGGPEEDGGRDVVVDQTGTIHIVASVFNAADEVQVAEDNDIRALHLVEPDQAIDAAATGTTVMLLAALSPDGDVELAHLIGGPSLEDPRALAINDQGHLTMAGIFYGVFDLDPGPGVVEVDSGGTYDTFVAQYNLDGTLNWASHLNSTNHAKPFGVAVGPNGAATVVGNFRGTLDADPGVATVELSSWVEDPYVIGLDANGNLR